MHIYSPSKFCRRTNSKLWKKNILSQILSKFSFDSSTKVSENNKWHPRISQDQRRSGLALLATTSTLCLTVWYCLAITVSVYRLTLNLCINCSWFFNRTLVWDMKSLITIWDAQNSCQKTCLECLPIVCVADPPSLPLKYYCSEHVEAMLTYRLGDDKFHEVLQVEAIPPCLRRNKVCFYLTGHLRSCTHGDCIPHESIVC